MKLNKKTLAYFDRKRKEKGNTCIIYIDAHGGETMEDNCSKDSATVFSFAGVSGAVAYAVQYEKDGKKMPSSLYYRDIISQVKPQELKQRALEMTKELKPHLKRIVDPLGDTPVRRWTRKHFDKYGMVSMKQLKRKEYEFLDTSDDNHKYDFGIYVLDASSLETKKLIGKNIISEDFLIEFFEDFPEAIQYLTELASSKENERLMDEYEKDTSDVSPNCIGKITFEELIHLLSLFGFDYSYIFDDSCRSMETIDENKILKLAEKERKVSLEKLPFKMKSTSMPKTRKRVLSDLKRGNSFVKDIRKQFHEKIKKSVYDIFDKFVEDDIELEPMEDTDEKMVFHLFIRDEKTLVIEILFDFLKVSGVDIKRIKRTRDTFIEPFINRLKQGLQTIHK